MKSIALVGGAAMLIALGAAVGVTLVGPGPAADGPAPEVHVAGPGAEPRTLTLEEAAARIESLETTIRRREQRSAFRAGMEDTESGDGDSTDGEAPREPPEPPLLHPDGRPYTADELTVLARGSEDPALRAQAIRALRRVDTDDARATLQAIFSDPDTPPDLRLLTARVLTRWPHRDHLPDELVEAFRDEEDPEVRRVLANGVGNLRDRRAWMREISTLFAEETDPASRAVLFRAVARSSNDPAAREVLMNLATAPGANRDERLAALDALRRGRPDAAAVAALRPLLADADPELRARALRILSADRGMPMATLRTGLKDEDSGVRIAALQNSMRHLGRLGRDKRVDKKALQGIRNTAASLATDDPDPAVRGAAVNSLWNLPKKQRDAALAKARQDQDVGVRLTAYARSPNNIAKTATQDFVGGLSSPDRWVRDLSYAQLRRLHGVRVPFEGRWNDAARAAAIEEIRRDVAGTAD